MNFHIRRATPEDAAAVAHIRIASWRDSYAGLLPAHFLAGLSLQADARRRFELLSQPRQGYRETWLLEAGALPVGFASLGAVRDDPRAAPDQAELYALYLLAQWRGQGGGLRLHDWCLARLHAQGARGVQLWVLRGNAAARGFYEAAGWRRDGGSKQVMLEGVELDEIRYRIAL